LSGHCRDLRPLLGAYVLGALDAEENAAVREHLASCGPCAAEHTRLAPLPGLLTLAAGAEEAAAQPLPDALEERLLDAVAHEAPARHRHRRWPRLRLLRPRAFAAGGLAVAAIVAAAIAFLPSGAEDSGYELTLKPTAAAGHAAAWAELHAEQGGTSMHLWVKGLPGDSAKVYEVHCDSPSWSASAGTFRVDSDGKAYVVLNTAARQGEYDAIRVVRRGDHRTVFAAALNN
jgi:anti-sigma factor RsiW